MFIAVCDGLGWVVTVIPSPDLICGALVMLLNAALGWIDYVEFGSVIRTLQLICLVWQRHHGAAPCYSITPTIVVPLRCALTTTMPKDIVINYREGGAII